MGFEPLTLCPYELDAIETSALSPEETALLNTYHETVYETLSPYFTEEEKAWLKQATRPI